MAQNKLLIILITIISVIAIISYLASPVFKLRDIEINDLQYISQADIKNKLAPCIDENIWLLTRGTIAKKLLKNKYMKAVKIKKKYPDTLQINIVERTPVVKINNNGKYTVVTADGFILEEGAMNTSCKVPLIVGTAYSFSDTKLQFPDKIDEIVQALEKIDKNSRTNINKIIIKDNNKLDLMLSSNIEVFMGNLEEIERKFEVYSSIYRKISGENITIDYIDLRVVDKPVICRKK